MGRIEILECKAPALGLAPLIRAIFSSFPGFQVKQRCSHKESPEHPWKPGQEAIILRAQQEQGWEPGIATSRNKERGQRQMPRAGRDTRMLQIGQVALGMETQKLGSRA